MGWSDLEEWVSKKYLSRVLKPPLFKILFPTKKKSQNNFNISWTLSRFIYLRHIYSKILFSWGRRRRVVVQWCGGGGCVMPLSCRHSGLAASLSLYLFFVFVFVPLSSTNSSSSTFVFFFPTIASCPCLVFISFIIGFVSFFFRLPGCESSTWSRVHAFKKKKNERVEIREGCKNESNQVNSIFYFTFHPKWWIIIEGD